MYAEIERQIRRQQWFNQTMQWLWWTAWGVLIGILLCHRVFTIEGHWLLLSFVVVPVLTWIVQLRYTVPKQQVLHYAESVSGGTGLIWFGSAVEDTDWSNEIDSTWKAVSPPVLEIPSETRDSIFVSAMSIAMLWVPLRVETNMVYPTLVDKELTSFQEDVESFETLLDDVDPEVEAWKKSLEQIEQGMSVGSTLRELDQMSEQLERRQEEAMESVEKAMDALEQGDEQKLTDAIQSLQKQNMMSSSTKSPVNKDNSDAADDSVDQSIDPENSEKGSDKKTKDAQKKGSQEEEQSLSQQQLQKQLQQLQQSLQKMAQESSAQNSSQSSSPSSSSTQQGMKSFSNDELQKMSEMAQQTNNSSEAFSSPNQNPTGQQGAQNQESQSGQGNQEGQEGQEGQSNGGSEESKPSSGSPSDGGGTSPLTYGNSTLIPLANMRALEGVPQVDWENSIAFGSAPGEAGEVQTVPVSTDGTSQSNTGSPIGQIQIPPQHREVVQDFYAVDKDSSQ